MILETASYQICNDYSSFKGIEGILLNEESKRDQQSKQKGVKKNVWSSDRGMELKKKGLLDKHCQRKAKDALIAQA